MDWSLHPACVRITEMDVLKFNRGYDFENMKKLQAYLNHGRWVVDCPNCNSAELGFPGQAFVCMTEALDLARADLKSQGRDMLLIPGRELLDCAVRFSRDLPRYPVEFPDDKEAIESLMVLRPLENRNWNPGETLADLRRENREHGIKV